MSIHENHLLEVRNVPYSNRKSFFSSFFSAIPLFFYLLRILYRTYAYVYVHTSDIKNCLSNMIRVPEVLFKDFKEKRKKYFTEN